MTTVVVQAPTPPNAVNVTALATAGPEGPQGPPGTTTFSMSLNQELVGDKDGVNMLFTFSGTLIAGSSAVYINGLRQRIDIDYVETTASSITFDEPPLATDDIWIDYINA